ncbi:MAG TPA: PH domain-containing protein [Chloroflexota bacterium]|nr:PH domain-containing protein [Chloroflexota bacterium]
MPYCPGCGDQHAADDRFCAKCGRALAPDAVAPAPAAPAPAPAPAPAEPAEETMLWEGAPHGLLNPIETHAIRWVLSSERLRVVRGLLNRSTEEVELTRVRDVSFEQSLAQRALGIGTVTVVGTDATAPTIVLHDVEEPEQVKELIRQAVRDQRRRHRVRQVESEDVL